ALLNLKKKGEGPVIAGDIEATHDVEIINPEHVIAHLSPGGKIEMQIKVENGRGYIPGNLRVVPEESKGIGKIILDASFSPVRRVSRSEEHTSELQSRGHLVCRLLLEKKNMRQSNANCGTQDLNP